MKHLRPILPEILMIAIMVAVSLVYMSPVFEGKTLPQGDVIHAQDQMEEVKTFQEETGVYPGWTNSAFAGMPTYQLKSPPSKNIYNWMFRGLKLYLPGYTVAILFLSFLGFYILLRTLKLNNWLALAGALAFGLSAHHLQLIATGHVNKIYSVAFMAPVIAGMFMVFKKKYLAGGLLTAIGLGIQISTNHVQVTYYLGIMVLIYMLIELVYALKQKYFDHFLKASLILFAALILAILPNMTMLLTTYEYAAETTRGKTNITADGQESKGGLDLDYMTAWSYGVGETFNLFIPNLYGGGSGDLDENSETYKDLQKRGIQNASQIAKYAPTYWGSQPFTAGPHYVGALTIFLAILGLFLIRGPKKWWLMIVILLSILLSWGSNFMTLTEFFAKNIPMYAKFRDMTNNLLIAQFAIPLLAFLGIRSWIMDEKRDEKEKLKKLYIGTGIAGGIALIFALMPGLFLSFSGPLDPSNQAKGYALDALIADREMLARKDAFRSLIIVLIGAGLLYAHLKLKVKSSYIFMGLALVMLVDLWGVDKRYLNADNFVTERQLDQSTKPTQVDQFILQDPAISYRVFDVGNPFKNSKPSRYHKSLGGYHAAKLGRYQNIIDRYMMPEYQALYGVLTNKESTIQDVNSVFGQMTTYSMLNGKYFIMSPDQQPLTNSFAMGNAWFVDRAQMVDSEAEELDMVGKVQLHSVAVVNQSFADNVAGLKEIGPSPIVDEILLEQCDPNYLKYTATNSQERLAVFTEIWYPHGWKAFVNGEESEIIRVNYLLRGLVLPAGNKHEIEFRFEPNSLKVGQTIALISSILVLLLILGFAYSQRANCLLRNVLGKHSQEDQ